MASDASDAVKLTRAAMLGWAVGSIVTSTFVAVQKVFYLRFMTDYVMIPAGVAAMLLILPKFLDVLLYPCVGFLSDRSKSRFGRRRPFMLGGSCLLAATLALMYTVPSDLPLVVRSGLVMFFLVAGSMAIGIFNVPFLAMPAEITDDQAERSQLIEFRVYAMAIGQMITGGVAPLLIGAFAGGMRGHQGMALTMAAYILLAGVVCVIATRGLRATELTAKARESYWRMLPDIFRNKNYVALVLSKFTFLSGVAAHTATTAYYVKYVIKGQDADLSLFLVTYSIGMVASQPLWSRALRKVGKIPSFIAAALIYAIVSVVWMMVSPGSPWALFLGLLVINGIGAGGLVLSSQAMLPDAIDEDYRLNGIRREASLSSFYVLAEKASYAVGLALVASAFEWYGYKPPTAGNPLPEDGVHAVALSFGGLPAVLMVLSILSLGIRLLPSKPSPKRMAASVSTGQAD